MHKQRFSSLRLAMAETLPVPDRSRERNQPPQGESRTRRPPEPVLVGTSFVTDPASGLAAPADGILSGGRRAIAEAAAAGGWEKTAIASP